MKIKEKYYYYYNKKCFKEEIYNKSWEKVYSCEPGEVFCRLYKVAYNYKTNKNFREAINYALSAGNNYGSTIFEELVVDLFHKKRSAKFNNLLKYISCASVTKGLCVRSALEKFCAYNDINIKKRVFNVDFISSNITEHDINELIMPYEKEYIYQYLTNNKDDAHGNLFSLDKSNIKLPIECDYAYLISSITDMFVFMLNTIFDLHLILKKCEICHSIFIAKRSTAKYCSEIMWDNKTCKDFANAIKKNNRIKGDATKRMYKSVRNSLKHRIDTLQDKIEFEYNRTLKNEYETTLKKLLEEYAELKHLARKCNENYGKNDYEEEKFQILLSQYYARKPTKYNQYYD